jgi:hypothetical protein
MAAAGTLWLRFLSFLPIVLLICLNFIGLPDSERQDCAFASPNWQGGNKMVPNCFSDGNQISLLSATFHNYGHVFVCAHIPRLSKTGNVSQKNGWERNRAPRYAPTPTAPTPARRRDRFRCYCPRFLHARGGDRSFVWRYQAGALPCFYRRECDGA